VEEALQMTPHVRYTLGVLTIFANAAQQARTASMVRIFRVCFIVLYLGPLALAGYGLSQVVQTGDWENLWKQLEYAPFVVCFIPVAFLFEYQVGGRAARELVRAFAAIRAAAERGDERIAPLAANQPLPRGAVLDTGTTASLGPLHGPHDSTLTGPVFTLIPALLGAMALLVLAATATIFWFGTFGWTTPIISSDPTTDALIRGIWVGSGVMLLGVAVACVWAVTRLEGMLRRGGRGMTLSVDGQGLAWTETATGKRRRIAWSEASLFFLVADTGGPGGPGLAPLSVHGLLGPGIPLVWMTPSRVDAAQWAAHTQLCQLIVTASHLPLRDLSRVSEEFAQVTRGAVAAGILPLPGARSALLGPGSGSALPGVSPERIRGLARRQLRILLALETPYVLLFLAAIVGSILQHIGGTLPTH
jgi:hypothetical protein